VLGADGIDVLTNAVVHRSIIQIRQLGGDEPASTGKSAGDESRTREGRNLERKAILDPAA